MIETSTERSSNLPSDAFLRRLRWLELALVLAVAFALPVLSSLYLLFSKGHRSTDFSDLRVLAGLITEATTLCVLFYVLFRQGRNAAAIGLTWNPRALAQNLMWAFVLTYAARYAAGFTRLAMAEIYPLITGRALDFQIQKLPVLFVTLPTFLFVILNGWFEELIVRAFAMTEVQALTKSPALAILFSVALQTSYHFYQGAPIALSYAPLFLIFALFYSRTRNIVPVALAHIAIDMISLFQMSGHH